MIFPEGVTVDHDIEVSVDQSVFSLALVAAVLFVAVRIATRGGK